MTITRARLDDGNGRVLHAVLDKAGATTRNEHVDQTGETHELIGCLAARVLDALDAVNGQAGTGCRLGKNARDGEAGALCQAATAQNASIARLDAQASGIGGDVGACLVDHRDDSKRHAILDHAQSVIELASLEDFAEHLGLRSNLSQTVGNAVDAFM